MDSHEQEGDFVMSEKIGPVSDVLTFEKIIQNKDKMVVLVYASWCPFCQKFLPIFNQYANRNPQYFLLLQDDQEKAAVKYSVDIYPTVLFFENGTISERLDGQRGLGLQADQLIKFIDQCHIPSKQDMQL